MTLLGQFALWTALIIGVWAAVIGFSGRWHGKPELAQTVTRAVYAQWAVLLVASASLWQGLISHDFNIQYVASYTSRNLPGYYIVSAFWAGQKGSLLFWAVVLATFASLSQWLTSSRFRALLPYVGAVTSSVVVFFVSVMLFAANPFERLPFTPADGNGLNPQLQNIGMVIHPPMLYLGYISITIPFAFGIAALLARRLDAGWVVAIRKWTLMSWLFLSIGITLGMWWAYVELGWGGYWAWDPVENASLLPWLTMSAFLHSVMIQEKRGMLKRWNISLVIGSFLLSIFGTFITRSGIIASVHSFTQSNVGYFFLAFLIGVAVLSFTLLYTRWDRLEADTPLESMVSREAAFLFNNLLFVGIAFSVLWGTLFPILSEAVRGTKISVGPPFFNKVNVPLGLLLLALTGIGPLIAWRKASTANLKRQFTWPVATGMAVLVISLLSGMRDLYPIMALSLGGFVLGTLTQEFVRGTRARHSMYHENYLHAFLRLIARNRRRYGGYIVHLGIVVYGVAFAGMAFKVEKEATLRPGESTTLRSAFGHEYTFTHMGISQFEQLNRVVSQASVEVRRDGKSIGVINSEKRQHFSEPSPGVREKSFEPSTEVGIRSTLQEDLYIVFAGSVNGSEEAVYRFTLNPLVIWVWLGGVILVIGGLITMWPGSGGTATGARRTQAGYEVQLAGAGRGMSADRRGFLRQLSGWALLPAVLQASPPSTQEPSAAGQGETGTLRDPVSAGRSRERVTAKDNDSYIMEVEKRLQCTCGCTLDIYTCRTTDFTCTYSPDLHKEVVALHDSGLTADQIVAAFVDKYGEKVLMAPKAEGFNYAGYLVPGALLLLVGGALFAFLRRRAQVQLTTIQPTPVGGAVAGGPASTEELARLEQALRESEE